MLNCGADVGFLYDSQDEYIEKCMQHIVELDRVFLNRKEENFSSRFQNASTEEQLIWLTTKLDQEGFLGNFESVKGALPEIWTTDSVLLQLIKSFEQHYFVASNVAQEGIEECGGEADASLSQALGEMHIQDDFEQ